MCNFTVWLSSTVAHNSIIAQQFWCICCYSLSCNISKFRNVIWLFCVLFYLKFISFTNPGDLLQLLSGLVMYLYGKTIALCFKFLFPIILTLLLLCFDVEFTIDSRGPWGCCYLTWKCHNTCDHRKSEKNSEFLHCSVFWVSHFHYFLELHTHLSMCIHPHFSSFLFINCLTFISR